MSGISPPADPDRSRRANTVIVGVNKAGTTSLFVSLSGHPAVAASSVKETRYFLPARWGRPLEPVQVYEDYFRDVGDRPVRLEATPSYFYGGEPLVQAMHELLGRPKVVVVLREPVSRLVSFFTFQKARLRLPADMTLGEYVAAGDRFGAADFRDPDKEPWFGFRGGCYADYLPAWLDASGRRPARGVLRRSHRPADRGAPGPRGMARDRPGGVSEIRAQLGEPHDGLSQPRLPAGGARVQRPVRAVPPAPSRAQGAAPRRVLPGQREKRARARPRRPPRRADRAVSRAERAARRAAAGLARRHTRQSAELARRADRRHAGRRELSTSAPSSA